MKIKNDLGFQFDEEMNGFFSPKDNSTEKLTFNFWIRSINPNLQNFLKEGEMKAKGFITVGGIGEKMDCEGKLIMPVRSPLVDITLNFSQNGKNYCFRAQKKLTVFNFIADITTFKGQLFQDLNELGYIEAKFNLKKDFISLLTSFKFKNLT